MSKINLGFDWKLRYERLLWGHEMHQTVLHKEDGWLDTNLPCDVHMPLIAKGLIKEPLDADNSSECRWVEDKSWWFKKIFHTDNNILADDIVELVLESLDAESDIFLNGTYLGHHKSTFYPFRKEVKKLLNDGENMLLVRLSSGLEYYNELDISDFKRIVGTEKDRGYPDRGDERRIMVRKPQYVYGWDWGPRVASCGIMGEVYIQSFSKLAVRQVHALTKVVDIENKSALLEFQLEIENLHPFSTMDADLIIELWDGECKVSDIREEVLLRSGLNHVTFDKDLENARLWWPNGMGDQPLYDVRVSIKVGNIQFEYPNFKLGIRTICLNQDKLNDTERKFAVTVNGITIFCKGGNWIPADSIYARVTDDKYDTLVREAKEANFNMLRVWGGGFYEMDIFYQKCDEYGILLWHDFMFACSMYPDNLEWFRAEVEKEMDYQTRRLRNHASIALWCGNNENTWGFDEWWKCDAESSFYGGAECYNKIAPRIIQRNCPEIPYWNSSPYGGEHPNGNDMGDRHHWSDCTMNEDMEKRITPEEYDKVTSKFVSEYGYIGPCRKSSIIKYHAGSILDKSGHIWQLHNNTFEKETVPAGIKKHYRDNEKLNMDEYLLYAGLCQGLMYNYSLEALRFKENCWGSLFWMYNDCWGEVGWTIIDYYLKRKISYYFVKRAFAHMKLILREENGHVKVVGINDTAQVATFQAEYGYTSFDGNTKDCKNFLIEMKPHSRQVVLEFDKGIHDFETGTVYIKPLDSDCVFPALLRQQVFRNLIVQKPQIKTSDFRKYGNTVKFKVHSSTYAHGVHFDFDDSLRLSDEYFDLLPGEVREIIVYDAPAEFSSGSINPMSIINE